LLPWSHWYVPSTFKIKITTITIINSTGLHGSPNSGPGWTSEELFDVLLRDLGDGDEAMSIRKKAAELGKRYQSNPGCIIAAREVAKIARSGVLAGLGRGNPLYT
jgi:hypothetical protein